MLPFIVGAVGLGALFLGSSGCGDKKKNSSSMPQAEPETLTFYKTGSGKLWFDNDQDGKEIPQELLSYPSETDADTLLRMAKQFISDRLYFQPPCHNPWQVQILPKAKWESAQGEAKKRLMTRQIERDIKAIRKISEDERPGWMRQLLEDLNLIKEELPYLKFKFGEVAKPDEEPKEDEVPAGFLATYDDYSGELLYTAGDPHALMVHEFDHAVTARVRVEPWAIANKVKCEDGSTYQYPMTPYRQTHDQVKTSFEFYVNLENKKDEKLIYDSWQYYLPYIYKIEHGEDKCLSEEEKAAPLADEVHAYLVMARYLLWELVSHPGVQMTQSEIAAAGRGDPTTKKKLEAGLKVILEGKSITPSWVWQRILLPALEDTYGGKNGSLKTQIHDYYAEKNIPGFVDPPDCHGK